MTNEYISLLKDILADLERLMDEASIVEDQHSFEHIHETYIKYSEMEIT